ASATAGGSGVAGAGSAPPRPNSRPKRPAFFSPAAKSSSAMVSLTCYGTGDAAGGRAVPIDQRMAHVLIEKGPLPPMTAEEINARLLFRDGLMLVIDKPAGIAVHRGPKGGPCLEDAFGALRFGLPRSPALAHRLDRETSGCLVLGRHRKALEKLGL